jgi:PAS domain S-box-containing protein
MQPDPPLRRAPAPEQRGAENTPSSLIEAAVSQLAEGVILADVEGRITFVNEAAARMHGVAHLDVPLEKYSETYHLLTEDGRPYPSAELPLARAVMRGETVMDERWRIRRPDGTEIHAVGSARPVTGSAGERLGAVLTLRDDTPRVEAERAQQHAVRILDQVADEHLTMDANFRILSVNRAAMRALGVPAEALVGKTHWEAFPASVGTEVERQYRRVAEQRVEAHFAHHYVGEGYDRYIEIDAYPTDEGSVAVFWREVSARVHAQEDLHAHNEQLAEQALELELANQQLQDVAAELEQQTEEAEAARRAAESERARATGILEAMADAYFALDPEYRIESVNTAMEAGSGLPRDALLGRVFWEAFPGAAGTQFERHYRAAATQGVAAHFEHDYSDGRLDLVVSVDAYPREEGGIAVFWRDITDRARIAAERERLLRAERQARADAEAAWVRAETVLASIADAFYLLDRDWRFTYVNDAAEPLLQTSRERLLGRTLWEAFPGVVGSEFEAAYREAMEAGRVTSVEAYFEPLGTWFDVRTYPWTGGIMIHFRDVGPRKRTEAERERLLADAQAARVEAETANEAKSQFLTTMSHELRTPLNAISGFADLLLMGVRGSLSPQQHSDVERIYHANQYLTSLVNDVLNFARLNAGQIEYHKMDFDLATIVQDLEPLLEPQFAAKGLTLDHDACASDTPDRPHRVHADPEKLRQILLNLLTNALKFTDAGGRVAVRCETDAAAGVARIRVSDTGRGIREDQLDQIFEPFVQVDRYRTQESQQGLGLGLAISRDLALGMGCSLEVESQVGAGSTFTVTLPLA